MSSRWNPRISRPLGSGSQPVESTDHFEATIIVGNVPAGDPNVAQVAPFRYIPDPGDGSGIALALSEAAATLGQRIRIRPGVYNMTAPLLIPYGCHLEGSGEYATRIFQSDGNIRRVFSVSDQASVRDLEIQIGSPGGTPVGEYVVQLAATAVAERLTIAVGLGQPGQENDSLLGIIRANGGYVFDCSLLYYDWMTDPTVFPTVACVYASSAFGGVIRFTSDGSAAQVYVNGLGYRVTTNGRAAAVGTVIGRGHRLDLEATLPVIDGISLTTYPLVVTSTDSQIDLTLTTDANVRCGVMSVTGSRNDIRFTANVLGENATNIAISVTGDYNNVRGWLGDSASALVCNVTSDQNSIVGLQAPATTLNLSGDNNIVVASRFSAVNDTGTGNEIAHILP